MFSNFGISAQEHTKIQLDFNHDQPVANSAGVMQAVFGDMGLEVDRTAAGTTLRADVRRLVLVDPLV